MILNKLSSSISAMYHRLVSGGNRFITSITKVHPFTMKSGYLSKSQPCFYVVLGLLNLHGISNGIYLNPDEITRLPRAAEDIKGGGCELPEHPDFGQWLVLGAKPGKPKEMIEVNAVLKFDCNAGYKLSKETKFVVCYNGSWSLNEMPKCLKMCPPLYSTEVTKIQCHDNRSIEIKCDEATNGTSAAVTCAPYYESSDRITRGNKINRYCLSGSWDLPPPLCQLVCGEKRISAEPLVVNGQQVKTEDYPWITAIYHLLGNEYTLVCEGSMLAERVILTAAHCVTNYDGSSFPKENITVGVGKYYNKYKDPRDLLAQYSKINKIIVPRTYNGNSQHYVADMALLITEDVLLLSSVVQPVCFQDLPSISLDDGFRGVFSGWGFTHTDSSPSDELQEVALPFKSDLGCLQEIPSNWNIKFYAFDKMCAGYYNKSVAVCKSDNGGGLYFKNEVDGRFYVHGVLSVGNSRQVGCDIQFRGLYTKVASHYDWLKKSISQYVEL